MLRCFTGPETGRADAIANTPHDRSQPPRFFFLLMLEISMSMVASTSVSTNKSLCLYAHMLHGPRDGASRRNSKHSTWNDHSSRNTKHSVIRQIVDGAYAYMLMLICSYAYMLICLYAYMLICLYACMLICSYAYILICL